MDLGGSFRDEPSMGAGIRDAPTEQAAAAAAAAGAAGEDEAMQDC